MDIWIYSLFVLLGIFSVIYINKYRDIVLAFIYCFLVLIMGLAYGQADYDNYIGLIFFLFTVFVLAETLNLEY